MEKVFVSITISLIVILSIVVLVPMADKYIVLRLGAVPHTLNLIINHCTISGIALNRCYVPFLFENYEYKH